MFKVVAVLLAKIGQSQVFTAALASAFFLAIKGVIVFLMVSVLAIVLHNFLIDFITDYLASAVDAYGNSPDGSALQTFTIQLSGIGAYLGGLFKIPEAFSVLMAGFSIGAVRSFIPFIGK